MAWTKTDVHWKLPSPEWKVTHPTWINKTKCTKWRTLFDPENLSMQNTSACCSLPRKVHSVQKKYPAIVVDRPSAHSSRARMCYQWYSGHDKLQVTTNIFGKKVFTLESPYFLQLHNFLPNFLPKQGQLIRWQEFFFFFFLGGGLPLGRNLCPRQIWAKRPWCGAKLNLQEEKFSFCARGCDERHVITAMDEARRFSCSRLALPLRRILVLTPTSSWMCLVMQELTLCNTQRSKY